MTTLCAVGAEVQYVEFGGARVSYIAHAVGNTDVAACGQAIAKSTKNVVALVQEMVRDHCVVNARAFARCKKPGVAPKENPTS